MKDSVMRSYKSSLMVVIALVVGLLTPTAANAATAPVTAQPNSVGVVGGSITKLAVQGYRDLGGTVIWPPYQIGGGTIFAWQNNPTYFTLYQQMLNQFPTTSKVWWQLAAHDYDLQGLTLQQIYATSVAVLNGIRQRTGTNTVVTASVMADYAPDTGCYLNNTVVQAPAKLQAVLDRLVSEGRVVAGPHMPTLHRDELQDNGDNCHQNTLGQQHHGRVLHDYFD
jgi:hypothetical protein